MAEQESNSDPGMTDKGKGDNVGESNIDLNLPAGSVLNSPAAFDLNVDLQSDQDQTRGAFQDYTSDEPDEIPPFKKRRGEEGHEIKQGAPSNIQQDPELKHDKIPHNSPAPPSDSPAQVQENAEGPGSSEPDFDALTPVLSDPEYLDNPEPGLPKLGLPVEGLDDPETGPIPEWLDDPQPASGMDNPNLTTTTRSK